MTQRSRNWCFTHFEKDNQKLNENINCRYIIFGTEICPETKREHIQGFVYFNNALTLKSAQKAICNYKIHIEKMKGSHNEAIEYCKKDGVFREEGERPIQGVRKDLDKIKEAVGEGQSMSEIIELASNYQSMRMGELLLKYKEQPREIVDIESLWFFGKNAALHAWKEAIDGEDEVYTPISAKWWDGYDNHKIVLLDDPNIIKIVNLDKLTNRFPFRVETKGGSRQAKYNKIIFTTENHPALLGIDQDLLKRIKLIDVSVDTDVGGNTDPNLCDCLEISEKEKERIAVENFLNGN